MSETKLMTLPKLANLWSVSLDSLREFVRRIPALKELGTKYGPTRCYNAVEVRKIKAAWDSKRSAAEVTS